MLNTYKKIREMMKAEQGNNVYSLELLSLLAKYLEQIKAWNDEMDYYVEDLGFDYFEYLKHPEVTEKSILDGTERKWLDKTIVSIDEDENLNEYEQVTFLDDLGVPLTVLDPCLRNYLNDYRKQKGC